MIDDTPLPASGTNRRENFRINDVLPVSLRKATNNVLPTAHIFPVAIGGVTAVTWEGGMNSALVESDSNFSLLLIEINAKLDLLLGAKRLPAEEAKDPGSSQISMDQLLIQINAKLEHLLGINNLVRPDDKIRIGTVCLSASGIKLTTEEAYSFGDLVEIRMLMNLKKPFWIVVGGTVVRATTLPTGKHEVAINFADMDEAIQDEISRYALLTHKKQLLARRGIRG